MIRLAIVLVLTIGPSMVMRAIASPSDDRVIVADRDPELRRATEQTLRPWRIEVVVDDATPSGIDDARGRADAQHAHFVVWREEDQLVIYDRTLDRAESRPTARGALAPVDAAAAALTIKTAMRLPAVTEDPVIAAPVRGAAATVVEEPERYAVRIEIGIGVDQAARGRYGGSVLGRPWRARGLRAGIAAELGATATVETGAFKGTAARWSVLGIASWSATRGALELAPYVAAGMTRSSLDGAELTIQRHPTRSLPTVRVGGTLRLGIDRWFVGAGAGVEWVAGQRDYGATGTLGTIYEVSAFALIGNVVVGLELL